MSIYYFSRSPIDRRESDDVREAFDLDYFTDGGLERRDFVERRNLGERRADWVRVSTWSSVYIGKQ